MSNTNYIIFVKFNTCEFILFSAWSSKPPISYQNVAASYLSIFFMCEFKHRLLDFAQFYSFTELWESRIQNSRIWNLYYTEICCTLTTHLLGSYRPSLLKGCWFILLISVVSLSEVSDCRSPPRSTLALRLLGPEPVSPGRSQTNTKKFSFNLSAA